MTFRSSCVTLCCSLHRGNVSPQVCFTNHFYQRKQRIFQSCFILCDSWSFFVVLQFSHSMEETHCWCKEIKGSPASRAVRQFQLCPSSLQGTTAWKLEYSDHVSSAAADHVDELGRYWLYEMLMIGKLYAIRKSLNINYVLDLPWKKPPKKTV